MGKKIGFLQNGPGIGPITNNNFRFSEQLEKFGVEVFLLGTDVASKVYDVAPKSIKVHSLEATGFIKTLNPLIRFLKKEKPDVLLVSGLSLHIISCIAKKLTGYPRVLVLRIHAHTSSLLEDRSWLNRSALLVLMRITHGLADYKVSISSVAASDWAQLLRIREEDIRVMYNPSVGDDVLNRSIESVEHSWIDNNDITIILAVARLAPEKSLDTLIYAFSKFLKGQEKDVRLIILGDGPLRESLEDSAAALGIKDLVDFHGWVLNPYAFMSKADLFVLTSWYEGCPNVVAEALACGCPVVSTDAQSGPREILDNGRFGRLVPVGDVDGIANEMSKELNNLRDRESLKERGLRFHVDRIICDTKDIFDLV